MFHIFADYEIKKNIKLIKGTTSVMPALTNPMYIYLIKGSNSYSTYQFQKSKFLRKLEAGEKKTQAFYSNPFLKKQHKRA